MKSIKKIFLGIRFRLQFHIILLILLSCGIIIGVSSVRVFFIREEIARSLITEMTKETETAFQNFFKPLSDNLLVIQKWGQAGMLDNSDVHDLNVRFIPILEQFPQISGMILASSDGSEYSLNRDKDTWVTRSMNINILGKQEIIQRWKDYNTLIYEQRKRIRYDLQQPPWFYGPSNTLSESEVYWTEPYASYTAHKPGITGSIRWKDNTNPHIDHAAAFNISLNEISKFSSELDIDKKGKAFVIIEDVAVIGLKPQESAKSLSIDNKSFHSLDKNNEMLPITDAIRNWRKKKTAPEEYFSFKSQSITWWGGFKPLTLGKHIFWVGVIVPEGVFISKVFKDPLILTAFAFAGLGLALVLAVKIGHHYSSHLENVSNHKNKVKTSEDNIYELIQEGETTTVEFKSTMRMNIKTNKPGKEIELAWLKAMAAFMNTDGGIVLIGVQDNGDIFGLEADEFKNDDKCLLHFKNLVNEHIGHEFFSFIYYELKKVEEKKILFVHCKESKTPVFLKTKNDEEFYIRTGPSSTKLSLSKALKYIKNKHHE
jgi:hypothetical protein